MHGRVTGSIRSVFRAHLRAGCGASTSRIYVDLIQVALLFNRVLSRDPSRVRTFFDFSPSGFLLYLGLEPGRQLIRRDLVHVCLHRVLHLDGEADSVVEGQPEVAPLVLELLSISVSELVFIANLGGEDILLLSDTEDEVIFEDLTLAHDPLSDIVLVDADHRVVGGVAELRVNAYNSCFVCWKVQETRGVNLQVLVFHELLPFSEVRHHSHGMAPLSAEEAARRILVENRYQKTIVHFEILSKHIGPVVSERLRQDLSDGVGVLVLFDVVTIQEIEASVSQEFVHHILETLQNQGSLSHRRGQGTVVDDLVLVALPGGLAEGRLLGHALSLVYSRK
mmetsp:Transcript_22921/g.35278  ORF Transcript_22921/g.35278 Transcript_22921/m.35278 type:complete len:337 (-) Transcript_22921:1965-2975(-)